MVMCIIYWTQTITPFLPCQYMDRFNEDIMQLKQGMVQENGSAYEPHASLVTEINKKAIFIFSKRIKQ